MKSHKGMLFATAPDKPWEPTRRYDCSLYIASVRQARPDLVAVPVVVYGKRPRCVPCEMGYKH